MAIAVVLAAVVTAADTAVAAVVVTAVIAVATAAVAAVIVAATAVVLAAAVTVVVAAVAAVIAAATAVAVTTAVMTVVTTMTVAAIATAASAALTAMARATAAATKVSTTKTINWYWGVRCAPPASAPSPARGFFYGALGGWPASAAVRSLWRCLRGLLANARSYSQLGSKRSSLATPAICQGMTA